MRTSPHQGITIMTHRNDIVQLESLSEHDKSLTVNQNPDVRAWTFKTAKRQNYTLTTNRTLSAIGADANIVIKENYAYHCW